ncbi:MAG TPA: glycosyltransferase, partial [Paludibacteraceae bacterium]|nr:glycosyltransferase [Paludibacteraceae bacterium]
LVILEGNIDYSPYAIRLLNDIAIQLSENIDIEVYGKFENQENQFNLNKRMNYKGFVKRDEVPKILKDSVYLSLDINPACPNTVVEALACGVPVVAFDTGALPELVTENSGIVVSYGSNPWELGYPDVIALVKAINNCFENYKFYSENAFNLAKRRFHLEDIFQQYMNEINNLIK